MASLLDLRRRIKSVKNTQKITKAMELVAAAKMRRAQERLLAARPYADEIAGVTEELMRRSSGHRHPLLQVREVRRRCLIVITADRGLAGALNSNTIRLALREMNSTPDIPCSVVSVGRKGRDSLRRMGKQFVADVSSYGDRPTLGELLPAMRVAMQEYTRGEVDRVDVVYSQFASAGRQEATVQCLLPIAIPEVASGPAVDFEYEPEARDVIDALLPRYVEAQVYRAVLENIASEQAARMLAMHSASDNASDLIADLTLTANKVRQATITTELMEVVAGSAAG